MIVRSLQHRIVIIFVGLLVLVMAIVLALVTRSNDRIVSVEMERELSAGSHVFTRLMEQNQRQLETAATILSADFAFREAIATQDRPTIRSVIRNHGLRIGAQAMMVISPDGQLIADTQDNPAERRQFPFPDLLALAESSGRSTGIKQISDSRLYQIVLVPILAPSRIAWVAMGFLVDDKWAHDLSGMTGLAISVVRNNGTSISVLASSFEGAKRIALPAALTQMANNSPKSLPIGDEHYQTVMLPFGQEASVVLQRSIEQAEAPFKSLQMALWTIVLAGVVIFSLGSIMLARRIVSPINRLAAAARRIEAGDYIEPVPSLPPDEIGKLAMSFDRMRENIASREQKILKLAYEDALTGLPNRTRLIEAFNNLPTGHQCAIAVLNLDRFALINSALGHPIGDRLLEEVGARLSRVIPGDCLAARLWGDEFAFLLKGSDKASAMHFAESVLVKLRETITLDNQRLDVGGSIGIALCPLDGQDAATLLRRAELAMNTAKRHHISVAFASDIGEEPQHEQLSLLGEMREALARQEFVIYYQPKLDLVSRQITGAEALIRWLHPERGLVPPMRFIPFAEQTGFIREITPWLIETVATQTAQWRKDGLFVVPSLNLSTLDLLNPGLVAHMQKVIEAHNLPANGLCLEITESALMEDPALALKHLGELAALGFKLSIDDYGTGQASLAYLRTLPVHELKIDRAFVCSVADTPKNAAIVRSTISLCHALGLSVVAEGAETQDDLAWLAANECDIAQGYGIARPMPANELPSWIAAYSTLQKTTTQ
jgi:diguanylate cyclase (GGDEF)-like protein